MINMKSDVMKLIFWRLEYNKTCQRPIFSSDWLSAKIKNSEKNLISKNKKLWNT